MRQIAITGVAEGQVGIGTRCGAGIGIAERDVGIGGRAYLDDLDVDEFIPLPQRLGGERLLRRGEGGEVGGVIGLVERILPVAGDVIAAGEVVVVLPEAEGQHTVGERPVIALVPVGAGAIEIVGGLIGGPDRLAVARRRPGIRVRRSVGLPCRG